MLGIQRFLQKTNWADTSSIPTCLNFDIDCLFFAFSPLFDIGALHSIQAKKMAKTIIITGASRGLGKIWTEAFLKRGDNVVAAVRKPEVMNKVLNTYPNNLLVLQLDVTDRSACVDAVKKATQHFGTIDTLINNAGYGHSGAIEELTEEEAKAQFETNFFGTLWMTQAILPIFRHQAHGHIIQVTSTMALTTLPTFGIYSASKFAVEGLSETLAQEVSSFGVNVTLLEPNGYETDFAGSSLSQSTPIKIYDFVRENLGNLQGARPEEMGKPDATADAVILLVDAEKPPLHLFLGKAGFPWVKHTYEQRIKTWEEWQAISIAAHGN
jgi:NAD(P)-dependent dehydrogenase (short-subunit alcohol dehydrogenase family)